jgi:hypothetical protein
MTDEERDRTEWPEPAAEPDAEPAHDGAEGDAPADEGEGAPDRRHDA